MMSAELVSAAAKLIGVLALMLGGLLAIHIVSRRFLNAGPGGGRKAIQVLESTPLGLKKSLALVKVPGAVLVVGVTSDRITLLDRVAAGDDEVLIENRATPPALSFRDQLRKFTDGWPRRPAEADGGRPAEPRS